MIVTRDVFFELFGVHVPDWAHRAYANGQTFDFLNTPKEELVWLSLLLMEETHESN